MIDIQYAPRRAHPNTNKVRTFTVSNCPTELIEQIAQAVGSLKDEGYIFTSIRFDRVESDFAGDRNIAYIVGVRMETLDECKKRVLGQERSNARKLQDFKRGLHAKRMRAEFNRLTAGLSLEQLQAITKKDFTG